MVARERIRATRARCNWSADALRLDELGQSFCEDGELELRGSDPVCGRDVFVPVGNPVGIDWLIRHRFVTTD
ncbi:hypothetical protein ACGFK1_25120 [Mycobacterium sp. NPDC048908]|uniref:hypothetical protein n=1 Tax=Mycobacterium sp. NPDC048908 TaxID=3364292 RepID=UPI00371DC3A1